LCYIHAVQSYGTLTKQRMKKVIRTGSVIGIVEIGPVGFGKFSTNVEFYIGVHISVEICRYQIQDRSAL
jgi:hypothetical protein